MRVSKSQLAKLCGVSARTVTKRCEGLKTWNGEKNAIEYESIEALPKILGKSGDSRSDGFAEKSRLTKAQADHEELKVAELRGELMRVDIAVLQWQFMLSAARAKLLSIGSRLAPRLTNQKKASIIRDEIDQVVYESLGELSETGLSDDVRKLLEPSNENIETAAKTDGKRVVRQRKNTKCKIKRRAGEVAN